MAAIESGGPVRPTGHTIYTALDGMRGIAATLIVFRHTKPLFGDVEFHQSYLAVDLFFVLSGFVIANAYEAKLLSGMSASEFIVTRAIRLYPLYLISLALSLIIWADRGHSGASLAWHGVLSLAFLPNPGWDLGLTFQLNGPTWSLFFEVVINIVYVLSIRFLVGRNLITFIAASGVGLLAYVIARGYQGIDLGFWVTSLPGGVLRVAFSFYVGVLIHRMLLNRREVVPEALRGNAAAWGLIAVVAAILSASPSDWMIPVFDVAAVFVVFPVLVYFATAVRPTGMTAAVFRASGLASYAIYVLHEPLGIFAGKAYTWVTGAAVSTAVPWIGIAFLPALVAACLFLDAYYDAPMRSWLRRRIGRRPRIGSHQTA